MGGCASLPTNGPYLLSRRRPPVPSKEGTAIATGTVKWYDLEKGYGFVYEDGANRDVFLHSADIQEPEPKVLYEGHRVRFEVEESERGPRAVEVLVVTGTERIDPNLDNPIPDIKDDLERAEEVVALEEAAADEDVEADAELELEYDEDDDEDE